MKASRFNRLFRTDDGTWLAFNGWTTSLAELEADDVEFIRSLLADPDGIPCDTEAKRGLREALVHGGFLLEDHFDEQAALKADLLEDRFRTDLLHLTIAPTMDCNFRCDYCYEEHLKVHMSTPVQDALLTWVERKVPTIDQLGVTWYGGEPLLPRSFPALERVSEGFLRMSDEHDLKYEATLVTNGYFLDRPKAETLARLGVRRIQVTLDGPPRTHDARRHLVGGKGTFWRIIENLEEVCDLAEFQIRINVDQRNAMDALEVVEILRDRGLGEKVWPYLAQVTFSGAACGNIQELCYSQQGFAETEIEIYREAAKRGLPLSRYPSRIAGAFCTADRVNGFVLAPNGLIFKCWHEVTMNPESSIGSLLDGQEPFQRANEVKWLSWDTLSKPGCQSCDVLPLCHGGCPLEAMKHPESDRGACDHTKFHLEPLLQVQHEFRPAKGAKAPARQAARDAAC